MAETKYGKYFVREPLKDREFVQGVHLFGEKVGSGNFMFSWHCIPQPYFMRRDSHTHDFDQFLCFLGSDPMNVGDFQAEVELSLGEELEKHIIDTTTIVYIPGGLAHCPLNFKKIDKPIVFIDIALTPHYRIKTISKHKE